MPNTQISAPKAANRETRPVLDLAPSLAELLNPGHRRYNEADQTTAWLQVGTILRWNDEDIGTDAEYRRAVSFPKCRGIRTTDGAVEPAACAAADPFRRTVR